MNPYVSVILTIAVCLLLFVLWIIYENYKNKKRILTKIRRNWGSRIPDNMSLVTLSRFPIILDEEKKKVSQ